MNNNFNFFVPFADGTIEKAVSKPIDARYDNMVLEGMASDGSVDLDSEVLEPSGYQVDHFLKNGYVNFEHLAKKSPKFIIGEPIEAKVTNNQFIIKAKLYKDSAIARDTWDKIIEIKKSGSTRRAGWSIEGKALERDPMNKLHITKALITNVAVTFSPTNSNSWADISKGVQTNDFVELEYEQASDQPTFLYEFSKGNRKFRVGMDYFITEIKKSTDDELFAAAVNVLRQTILVDTSPKLRTVLTTVLKNIK